jgi:ubiquinol-cytochrome c reductase cytochrome c subunit
VAAAAARPHAAQADDRADPRSAESIYLSDCSYCHGVDARGTRYGPDLTRYGRAGVDYALSTGRMPLVGAGRTNEPGRPIRPLPGQLQADAEKQPTRHEPAYTRATVLAIADYVAELTGHPTPDIPRVGRGSVSAGGELYRLQCAACHAWAGDGGALLHREAPSVHPATPLEAAEAIRVGPGQMPSFGRAALTDQQVDDVVAYVRYLRDPEDRGGAPLAHLGPFAEGGVALAAVALLMLLTRWIGERG